MGIFRRKTSFEIGIQNHRLKYNKFNVKIGPKYKLSLQNSKRLQKYNIF